MLIIVIFINGCSSSKDEEDKARTQAAERSAQQAAEEARRHGLPICQGNKPECAKGGVNCKKNRPATEPGVCWNIPTLTCICPPKTVCLMDTVTNPWPPIISSGHCKS